MSTPTIKTLRQSGYKVRVIHTRNYDKINRLGGVYYEVSARGGRTRIEITTPEGIDVWGEAICSNEDNWNRKIGNSIAVGRALQKIVDGSADS